MAHYGPQGNSLGAFANKFVPVSQVYSTTGKQVSPLSSTSAALANFLNQLTQGLTQFFFIHSLSIKRHGGVTNRGRLLGLPDRVAFPAGVTFFHVNVSRWGNPPNLVLYRVISNSLQIQLWRRFCIIQSDNRKPYFAYVLSDFSIILRVARFFLPHLSGLPHLPGASLLYVKRSLVIDYIAESLFITSSDNYK